MNVSTLQRIDRWLGVPLCFALTLVRKIFNRSQPDNSQPPRNILFVKLAEQGSTVLAYSALRRAVEMVGKENVYFVAFEDNRFILDVLNVIPEANVVPVAFADFPTLVRSLWLALRRLRELNLDAAVDMEFFARGSAALAYLSGARRRAGFHAFFGAGPYRGDLMTHRLLYNPHLHTTDTFLSLVEAAQRDRAELPTLGWRPPEHEVELPRFCPHADELARVKALVQKETGGNPKLILLNPNASDLLPLRRWPSDRYVELAKRLLSSYQDVCVAFTGSPNETAATNELVHQVNSPRCISLAGKTTLRELLALYSVSEVLVTNDSGPAHFATLTPIRVVTLFGPETPLLFAARTPRNTTLWAGIACSPCVNAYNNRQSPCRNNICMQAITVEQVLTEVARAL
jgi:ADP-heptose:LPS heptosyltransferase